MGITSDDAGGVNHGVSGHHDHSRSRRNISASGRGRVRPEAARSRELAVQGHLLRLWRPPLQPGEWRTLGLFAAAGGHFRPVATVLMAVPVRPTLGRLLGTYTDATDSRGGAL